MSTVAGILIEASAGGRNCRCAFSWSLVAVCATFAQAPQEAIHPKERYFTPDDVRKTLAGGQPGAAMTLPGGISSDLIANVLKNAAADPERFKSMFDMVQRAAGNLPLEQLIRDPSAMNPKVREFAERLARNPEFRDRLLENPEFRRLAESFRDRLERDGGARAKGGGNGAASRQASRTDPAAAVDKASRAFRKLWSTDGGLDGARGAEGRSSGRSSRPWWDSIWRKRDEAQDGAAERWAERLERIQQEAGSRGRDDDPLSRFGQRNRNDVRDDRAESSRTSTTSRATAGGSEPKRRANADAQASDDWFSWFGKRATKAGEWGAKTGERLGNWLPKLPAFKLPAVRIPQMRLPSITIAAPTFSGETGGFSAQRAGSAFAYLLVAIGLIAIIVAMSGKVVAATARGKATLLWRRRRSGDSAAERIQWLFEDAALARLGEAAATMNHRTIATQLGSIENDSAAEGFAELYERVRYQPMASTATPSDVDKALQWSRELKATAATTA